ncbi:MAG: cysteine desulfurase NifS [Clostridia bacterium]|nr:cysteine desulfurase NifS [Clostridia bacterium]
MARFVYVDNAATTPVKKEVIEAMKPCFEVAWGNPSSQHAKGREAATLLDGARETIAKVFNCNPGEIYFTSCGTESDNWAIKGAARRMKRKGRTHIVTSAIEHHAVLNTCAALEKEGFTVTYVGVDEDGVIKLDELRAAVNEKTALVSVMFANNEVGTIQPIAEITEIAHKAGALMFTDAVQAVGSVDIDLSKLPVDMLALSGHKIGAPKGIGMLFIRRGVVIEKLIDGGGQEKRQRGGTENLPYIVGLAKALEIAKEKLKDLPRVAKMRDKLISELTKIPYSKLNGHKEKRLAGNVNIGFEFIEGESMLLWLDISGICASTGSACSSASLEASHVLLAMGVPHEKAHGSLRLSLSHETTDEDVDYIIETLPGIVKKLREMSPLWENVKDK